MRGSEKRWAVNDAEPAGLERRCHLGSTVNSRLFGMSVEKSTLADQVNRRKYKAIKANVTEMHRARVRLMTWPPSELEWDKILEQLPAEARAATRTAVDAAVHDYSTDSEDPQSSLEHAQHWQRIKRLAASKGIAAFREAIRKLSSYQPLDEEARWLLQLADQLELLPRKAQARALFYRPRSKKARLYTAVIRSWTNASGFLGASEEGPLQRFVCRVVRNIGLRLSDRGAKAVIQREQERRAALKVLEEVLGAQANMNAAAFVINSSGQRTSD